jgi:hypothetical protein
VHPVGLAVPFVVSGGLGMAHSRGLTAPRRCEVGQIVTICFRGEEDSRLETESGRGESERVLGPHGFSVLAMLFRVG